jgi:hypothetical protein
MAVYPFGFTAIIYEEYDPDNRVSIYRRESGMGLADSYKTAAQHLEDYYGDDLVSIKHLELFAEDNLILLPEAVIMGYAKTEFGYIGQHCDVDGNILPEPDKTDREVIVNDGNAV